MLKKIMRDRRLKREFADLSERLETALKRDLGDDTEVEEVTADPPVFDHRSLLVHSFLGATTVVFSHQEEKGWQVSIKGEGYTTSLLPDPYIFDTIGPAINGCHGERQRAQKLYDRFLQMVPEHIEITAEPMEERVWPGMAALAFARRFSGAAGGKLETRIEIDRANPDQPQYKLSAKDGYRGEFLATEWFTELRYLIVMAERFEMMTFEPDTSEGYAA